MKDIQLYLDELEACTDEKTPGIELILEWYAEYDAKRPVDHAVHFALGSIDEIKDIIFGFLDDYPNYPIDLMLLEIFFSLIENDKFVWINNIKFRRNFSETIQLAHQLHTNHLYHLPEKKNGGYDNVDIQIIIYLLQNEPDFNNGKNPDHFYRLKDFFQPYLKAERHNEGHFNQEQIKLYFWILNTHPLIAENFQKTASWVRQIANSSNYRRAEKLFPNFYPFHHISFDTFTNDKAILYINCKTPLFIEPLKKCLSVFPEACDNRVHFNGPFDSAEQLVEIVEAIFDKVEKEILNDLPEKLLFHETRQLIINAACEFYRDYKAQFPGLKLLQFHPPGLEPEERDPHENELYHCIKDHDVTSLRHYLSTGLDPHNTIYHLTPLKLAVETLRCYTVHTMYGKPKFSCENGKDSDHLKTLKSRYNVIISKHHNQFYLHWMTADHICYKQQITLASDIAFLRTLDEKCFNPDGHLRSSNSCEVSYKLNALVVKFFVSTLEVERRNEAQKIVATTTLLLEFDADPSFREDAQHPGSRTVLEALIHSACSSHMDTANEILVTNLIMLLFRFDKNQSYLKISTEYRDHFVGKTLENGKKALELSKEIPKIIQAKVMCDENKRIQLRFENSKHKAVFLRTTRLKLLSEDEKISVVALIYEKFPHLLELDSDKIKEVLQSDSENSKDYIDLVTDQDGQVVGFSKTEIVLPTNDKETVLHLVPLAACEKDVSKDFARLMSIVSFRRIETLQNRHQREVLTFYLAASASSYLQISDLYSHPKRRCLSEEDWIRIRDNFYKDREIIIEDGVHYIKSDLYYVNEDKKQEFATAADINRESFNTRYTKQGFGTLVGFYSNKRNMDKLAGMINSRLDGGLSFVGIAHESACLDRDPGLPSARY